MTQRKAVVQVGDVLFVTLPNGENLTIKIARANLLDILIQGTPRAVASITPMAANRIRLEVVDLESFNDRQEEGGSADL